MLGGVGIKGFQGGEVLGLGFGVWGFRLWCCSVTNYTHTHRHTTSPKGLKTASMSDLF